MFVLVYTNEDGNAKRFNAQKYYLSKGIIKNYNIVISGKGFMTKQLILIYTDMSKSEDYTTGCLLDYDYIKNNYRLMAIDLIRHKN